MNHRGRIKTLAFPWGKAKVKMKDVKKKKYIGDIISSDGQNCKNIREKTNQSHGTINNVVSSLTE